MIIDLILDRKDGKQYSPKAFYDDVMNYHYNGYIIDAFDSGKEEAIKDALAKYILVNEYNHKIIDYITSVNWTLCEEK